MKYHIPFHIQTPGQQIRYDDRIMLLGSCFTEHIGGRFGKYGWRTLENPTGIIFNPNSIRKTIDRIVNNALVSPDELVLNNELWHHWDFHSSFSHIDPELGLAEMNHSIQEAYHFLKEAQWLILTIGSAFQYFVKDTAYGVSNCHRVPAGEFEKKMLEIEEIKEDLVHIRNTLQAFNPGIRMLLTISPVRHIRDGIIENNRSKARLVEAVHSIVDHTSVLYYPAYELMIDVLRDYRFYDVDMVHPNYAATQTVWEFLVEHYMDESTQEYLQKMIEINDAFRHRTRFPTSHAHQRFLQTYLGKVHDLKIRYPHWNALPYESYFSENISKKGH